MENQLVLRPIKNSHLDFAQLSHKGWVRANNEDRLEVHEFDIPDNGPHILHAVLCDGVGGHIGGEVAAQIGVYTVIKEVAEADSFKEPPELLRHAVLAANQAILDAGHEKPELQGMASTCITVLLLDKKLYLANLGDSRAYLLRKGNLFQLNYDHTWLQDSIGIELGAKTGITRNNPLAHVLSRYLGSPEEPKVDLRIRPFGQTENKEENSQGLSLQNGDKLLLCSDGVTDLLSDGEIANRMKCKSARKDAQMLVKGALDKGGHDNTSVIVIHI